MENNELLQNKIGIKSFDDNLQIALVNGIAN